MPTIQTVVVSIQDSPRRPVIKKYLDSQNIKFKFLDAANKNNLIRNDFKFTFKNFKICINSTNSFIDSFNGRKWTNIGEVGCLISQFTAWKDLLTSSHNAYLILEDDAMPMFTGEDLEQFVQTLDLQNIDLISCQCVKPSYEGKISFKDLTDNIKLPSTEEEFNELAEGAGGYIITKTGAEKLSYLIEQNGLVFPTDNHIWRCAQYSGQSAEVCKNLKFSDKKFNWFISTKKIQVSLDKNLSKTTQIHNTDAKHNHQIPDDFHLRVTKELMSNGITFIQNNIPTDNI